VSGRSRASFTVYHTSIHIPPYTYRFVASEAVPTREGMNSLFFGGTANMTFLEEPGASELQSLYQNPGHKSYRMVGMTQSARLIEVL
jgi:hypothetical protein